MSWAKTAAYKKSFTTHVDSDTRRDLEKAGIEIHEGTAAFTGPETLELSNGRAVRAETVVIATGQHPRRLDVPGGELAIDSDAFLALDDLPDRVAFIGAGYIGMEFACAAALAGRRVTVVAAREHPLDGFDEDAVAVLEQALLTLGPHGVTLVPRSRATKLEQTNDGVAVFAANGDTAATADLVVNATGRVASVEGLNLDAAGVAASPAGVAVDVHLRCPGNRRVWAGGDVADTGRPALIPTAVNDARVLVKNLARVAEGGSDVTLHEVEDIPPATVAFTVPTLASVGLTERAARERHGQAMHVTSGHLQTRKFYRQLGVEHAYFKLIFNGDRRLIGAHLAGPESEEVINAFAVAVHESCHEAQLCDAVFTYPTVAMALQAAYRKTAKG